MKKAFLQLFVFALLAIMPSYLMADVYLVSVGISDYPGIRNDLSLPAKDATDIADLYRTNTKSHVILIKNSDATKDKIIEQMNSLFSRAQKDDIIVLFFSGHGAPGAFCAYDGNMEYDQIRKAMAKSESKNKMIFADACFSGKIRQEGHSRPDRNLNVMLFLSSRSDEYSIENPSMKNGFFTACLLRCLKGGADTDMNRIITAKELFVGVSDGVKALSRDTQHPVMWGNFPDDMPVMIW